MTDETLCMPSPVARHPISRAGEANGQSELGISVRTHSSRLSAEHAAQVVKLVQGPPAKAAPKKSKRKGGVSKTKPKGGKTKAAPKKAPSILIKGKPAPKATRRPQGAEAKVADKAKGATKAHR